MEEKNINRDILKDIEGKNLVSNYDINESGDASCLHVAAIDKDGILVLCELHNKDADVVNSLINIMEKKINILQHRLNDVVFSDANNDVELAARYLRKIGYIGFNEDSKTYINLHNDEIFWKNGEREKDYYIKDEELDEYTKQLEHKLKEKNRILKEIYNRCDQMSAEIEEVEGSYSYYFEELKGLLPIDKED